MPTGSQTGVAPIGSLFHDRTAEFEIDDRSLSHLQVVILNKL